MRRSVAKEMNRIMGAALIWVLLWAKEKQTGIRRQQGRPAYKLERCRPVGRVCISLGRAKTKKINCTRILSMNRGSGTRLQQGRHPQSIIRSASSVIRRRSSRSTTTFPRIRRREVHVLRSSRSLRPTTKCKLDPNISRFPFDAGYPRVLLDPFSGSELAINAPFRGSSTTITNSKGARSATKASSTFSVS